MVQPQVQRLGNMALAAQVKTQILQPQGRQRLIGVQRQVDGDRRHFPGVLCVSIRHADWKHVHRPTGTEPALGLTRSVSQRAALDLGMPIHPLTLTDGVQLRIKPHDGATGHWPQIVRPQHVQQRMRQLGKLVLDLLTELPRQKRETFQQPFDIGVCTLLRKKPGQLRMRIRKLSAL